MWLVSGGAGAVPDLLQLGVVVAKRSHLLRVLLDPLLLFADCFGDSLLSLQVVAVPFVEGDEGGCDLRDDQNEARDPRERLDGERVVVGQPNADRRTQRAEGADDRG